MSLNKLFSALAIQTRSISNARNLNPVKFTSILSQVPLRPRSAWQLFIRENIKSVYVNKEGSGKEGLGQAASELSARWKALSDKEKEKFYVLYRNEKEAHIKAYEKAMNSATSKQFYEENLLRKKYKMPLLRDPKKPKRPMNGFMYYYLETRNSLDKVTVAEQSKIVSNAYKELSEAEKQVYKNKAIEASQDFQAQMEAYNKTIGLKK
ncbi:unnamed protein product [Rhizopus stolonifer]